MKDAYYFSHDSNASTDHKVIHMRSEYGWEGYGLYWAIVERLRDIDGHRFPMDRIAVLAYDLRYDTLSEFIDECINNFALFQTDGEYFWSASLLKRMAKLEEHREKRRMAAQVRWGTNGDNAHAMQVDSTCKAVKESKVKESKVKNKKKYEECVHMTETEYGKLTEKYGTSTTKKMIDKLSNYKTSKGKKYASDYRAILSWVTDAIGAVEVKPNLSTGKICDKGHTYFGDYCKTCHVNGDNNE